MRLRHCISPLRLLLCAAIASACAPAPTPAPAPDPAPRSSPAGAPNLVDEVAQLVNDNFYSTAVLEQAGWKASVARARDAYARASDAEAKKTILRDLLATLHTSHTSFYPPDDPAYRPIASIYQHVVAAECPKDRAPSLPVMDDEIGVFWKKDGQRWFVGGLYAGGPGEAAGLVAGDEVIAAEGKPFSPVLAFAGKAGTPVGIEIRRTKGGSPSAARVTPRRMSPQEAFREATEKSYRVIERKGKKIAYVRVWSWTSQDIEDTLADCIAKANRAKVSGVVIDLRDGWGGANPNYLSLFYRDVPILESTARDGSAEGYDTQIRGPAALIVNGGTRSGKEVIAYAAKKHGLAKLVGERTAGAVVAGRPYCVSDGSLLYLATRDARVDGERLEGRGVSPDVEVPFDSRYSSGQDAQLDRALDEVSGSARP